MSNYNNFTQQNQDINNNLMKNLSNEKFVNLASSIDLDTLNGTNIMDLNKNLNQMQTFNNTSPFNNPSINNPNLINNSVLQNTNQETNLVKSITKELINNLRENNIIIRDDNNSFDTKKDDNDYSEDMNYEDMNEDFIKTKKKSKNFEYNDELKKGIENMMIENGVQVPTSMSAYLFDELFNLKEFIILFGVYFLLSQEMIKDLFAQYFTSLNPDDTGRVNVKGVIIYGLILTVLYMIMKKVI